MIEEFTCQQNWSKKTTKVKISDDDNLVIENFAGLCYNKKHLVIPGDLILSVETCKNEEIKSMPLLDMDFHWGRNKQKIFDKQVQ